MKNLKITLSALALSGLALTSCMDEKKSKDADMDKVEMNAQKENKSKMEGSHSDAEKMMAHKKGNKMRSKDGKVVERSMNVDVNAMQISGWSGFNTLSVEMKNLEGADLNTMKAALPNFKNTIASLQSTRPEWMMTEEITEDIEDVQKEYNEYIKEQNSKEKNVKENIEELNEAYDDLVEEINETFDKYVKINRKAREEYREEMEDDGDIDDAREEYNEEIKKLNKVADDKK